MKQQNITYGCCPIYQQLRTLVASYLILNENLENTKQQGTNAVSQTQVWGRMLEFSIIIILAVLLQLLLPAMIPTKILKPVGKHQETMPWSMSGLNTVCKHLYFQKSVAAVQCQRWQYSIYPLDVTAFDAAVGTFFREQNSGVYYKGSSTQPGFLYISWHDKKLNPSWR